MSHPRKDIDNLIHSPVRFSLLAALRNLEDADFRFLADLLEVSGSTLSQALTALESAGYVAVRKESMGRQAKTWVTITGAGREAFTGHLAILQAIIDSESKPGTAKEAQWRPW